MIRRDLENILKSYKKFPVIAIMGPRQSGKTTLAREVFSNYQYVNAEALNQREFIQKDPKKFLRLYEDAPGLIIDEFQNVPDLLSYLQVEVDEKNRPGFFVLTGSSNFLMNQSISQSLAGRVGILTLLPFSLNELRSNGLLGSSDETILKGFYPRVYVNDFSPEEFYPSYIHTYVEKDVRQIVNIENLLTFQKFLELCAGRVGQVLNISDLSNSCGISSSTVERWLSVLQASYIIFLLQPYHNNFSKRVIQKPKIYFYDTGIVCSLLGIESIKEIIRTPFKGHLFENMIIADLMKQFYNQGKRSHLYFWRDTNGRIEVDALIKKASEFFALEIKANETPSGHFLDGLKKWSEISKMSLDNNYVIYDGDEEQPRSNGTILGWKDSANIIKDIYSE